MCERLYFVSVLKITEKGLLLKLGLIFVRVLKRIKTTDNIKNTKKCQKKNLKNMLVLIEV